MLGTKKGSGFDLLYVMLGLFTLAIVIVLCYLILTGFQTGVSATLDPQPMNMLANFVAGLAAFDYAYAIVLAGLAILSIAAGWFSRTHPIFFIVSLIMFVVWTIIGAALSNVFEQFTLNPQMASSAAAFPIITYVMANLPYYLLVYFVILMVALYGKPVGKPGGFGY